MPLFTDLRSVQTLVDGDRLQIRYGAQDVSTHDSGAYTGEISRQCWPSWLLVRRGGHSERREYHAESGCVVNAKAHERGRRHDADRVRGRGAGSGRPPSSPAHPRAVAGSLVSFSAEQVAGLVVA